MDERGYYGGILYLPATEANGFVPDPPTEPADVAYLCFPNNPTGAVATREQLARWVAWARDADAVLIFDAAYDAFIQDPAIPRSIYEIAGARNLRDRDALVLEARRIHRRPLRLHGDPEERHGNDARRANASRCTRSGRADRRPSSTASRT